jgi:hypothetical protein
VVFPQVSLEGTYTLVDYGTHDNGQSRRLLSEEGITPSLRKGGRSLAEIAGTPYQHVVRYNKEDGNGMFLHNVQIFPSSGSIDCTQSHVYWRVAETEVVKPGLTYTAGQLMQIPLIQSSQGSFCEMNETAGRFDDGSGVGVSMKMMEQPDDVHFAFNKLVDEGSTYYIQFARTEATLLQPVDSTIQYQYAIRDGSVAVQQVQSGGEFYMEVVFDVIDIEDDVEPGAGCLTLDEVVSPTHAYFGAADANPRCNITLATSPSGDPEVGDGRRYTLKFPQSQYEDCAESLTVNGDTLDFGTTLRLLTGSVGDSCFYFQPGSSQQAINIQVNADVTDDMSENLAQFSTELISITPERCEPLADYIVPQVTLKVVLNATFAVEAGSDVERVTTSIPYIEDPTYPLVPDTEGGGDAFTCTTTVGASGTFKQCQYYFKTSKCEKFYYTNNGECALEYNTTRFIEDLVFRETYPGGLFVIRRSPVIDTGLQAVAFDGALCAPSEEREAVDVSDTFPSSLALRNYYDDTTVDWTNTTQLSFNDKIIIRAGVAEAAGATFDNIELFIKSVTVTLRNPESVSTDPITSFTFNVREKEALMANSWTFFYEDPVFCSYYDSEGGPGDAENKCQAFYDPFGDQSTRWNGYNTATLTQPKIDNVCQEANTLVGAEDNRNVDFFMFDPNIWFADNVNAYMEVAISVSSVIHKCGANQTIPTARRLADGSSSGRELSALNPESQILYISKDIIVTVGGENGTTVTVVETEEKGIWEEHTGLLAALIATSAVMFCIIFGFGMFRLWRYRNDEYVVAVPSSARIHDF